MTTRTSFTIGRALECDISINTDTVSRVHLRIEKEGRNWYLIDNDSTNGTYLNGHSPAHKISKAPLKRGETLFLATYKLNTALIFKLIDGTEGSRKTFIYTQEIIIGRDPNADLSLTYPNLSWHHAKIVKENHNYYLYDLNSTNGTFVNNSMVKEKKILEESDKITLGLYSFIFHQEGEKNLTLITIEEKGIRIDVRDISLTVQTEDSHKNVINKSLLSDIGFTIYPGEIVGIMGLSGAGKTTLLKILSGYIRPTKGKIFLNGKNLYDHFNTIKNFIGYVPQEDIIHPELTVYEALFYSSKLRLSSDLSSDEINLRIDNVLKDLGIYEIKNVLIGSPDTKQGISGGQRKRVNIAMELLADPELLFLDEPTSGLSSVDTNIVMDRLKALSDRGKTILLTIHQPSLKNYKKIDNMIILSEGKLAYFGPTYPDSITFFNPETEQKEIINDPDNALLGLHLGEQRDIHWHEVYQQSKVAKKYVKERIINSETIDFDHVEQECSNSFWKQLKVLKERFLTIKLKDKANMALLLGQPPLIGLLLIFIFSGSGYELYKSHPYILLFILIISAVWFGVINAIKEIVAEKAIYERERLFGLKIIPYVVSKFMVLSVITLLQVILLLFIVHLGIDLDIALAPLILIVYITALIGVVIGLLISSIVKSVAQALTWVPLVLLPIIIFSGGMIPIKKMSTTPYLFNAYTVSFMVPTRWTLEELIRIYDNANRPPQSMPREPIGFDCSRLYDRELFFCEAENNALYPIDVYDGLDATCENRKCIQELYIGNYSDETFVWRNHSSVMNYVISLFYVLIPLILTFFVLRKKDKNY